MPLYLVRWPRLEASLVFANDEDHLTDILDEVDTPTVATWSEYHGPLWIDFNVGIHAEEKGNGHAWSVEEVQMAINDRFFDTELVPGEGETALEIMEAVFEDAFPQLAAVIQATDDEYDPEQVRAAALKDLETHEPSGILPKSLRDLGGDDDEN